MANLHLSAILCASLLGIVCSGQYRNYVEEVYQFKEIKYENLPQSANSWVGPYKYLIPENNNIMGYRYHPASGLMFVAISRVRPGIPITLGAFCVQDYPKGYTPKIWAFPDYKSNALRASDYYTTDDADNAGRKYPNKQSYSSKYNIYDWNQYYNNHHSNYDGSHHYLYQKPSIYQKPVSFLSQPSSTDIRITSVYQVNVDEKCNRAFFIDTGLLLYYANTTYVVQKPALVVYNLPSNGCKTRNFQLIRRAELPDSIASNNPFGFLYATLDFQSDNCDDLFVYMTNFFGNYLVVYDYKKDKFWWFADHPTFQPVIAESYFTYNEALAFQLPIGLISIALGYPDSNGDRTAYYVSASTAQYAVSTRVLKDSRKSPTNYKQDDFKIMGYRGCDSEAAAMIADLTHGVIFYTDIEYHKVRCWNMNKPLNPDNIGVVFESDKILYPLTLYVDSQENLWFDSSSLPLLYFTDDPLDLNTVNSRLFRVNVNDAIRGTVCEN